MKKGLMGFFIISEIIKQIVLYEYYGYVNVWYVPFQLCSLPIYLLPLSYIYKKKELNVFLFEICLIGGIFVFFDTSGLHYDVPLLTIHSYAWHICMILISICLFKECEFSRETLLSSLKWLLISCFIATLINVLLHPYGIINMFYISPFYNMPQIVFKDIAKITSQGFAKVLYVVMIYVAMCMIHGGAALYNSYKRLK